MRNRADLHTHEDTANMTEHDFRSWVLRDLAASALLSCVAHFGVSHLLCCEDTRRSPRGEGSSASRQCRFTIHEWEPPWKKIPQNLPNLQISTALANILTTTSTDPQTKTNQLNHSRISVPQKLGGIINVYYCFKPSLGGICYIMTNN